jgi:hypothetical protein
MTRCSWMARSRYVRSVDHGAEVIGAGIDVLSFQDAVFHSGIAEAGERGREVIGQAQFRGEPGESCDPGRRRDDDPPVGALRRVSASACTDELQRPCVVAHRVAPAGVLRYFVAILMLSWVRLNHQRMTARSSETSGRSGPGQGSQIA